MKAPELVKEYQASWGAWVRANLLKPGEHTVGSPMTTRPSSPTRLASSEIHSCTLGGHYIDGIQEALEGSSEVWKVWYNDSSPYTSRQARTAVINAESYASAGAPSQRTHHSFANARPDSDHSTSDDDVPDCPESVYKEEEDLGNAGMARESLDGGSPGEGTPRSEQAPPGDPRSSSFSLDMGDFVGGTLGGGDPVNLGPSGAQVRGSTTSGLDGELPRLAGHPRVKPVSVPSPASYSAYDHSEGDCLFDQADPTRD